MATLTQDIWGACARDGSARSVGGRTRSVKAETRLYNKRRANNEERAVMVKFRVGLSAARKIIAAARRAR